MKTYRVSCLIKARSKPDALARLDKIWHEIDPNLDLKAEVTEL